MTLNKDWEIINQQIEKSKIKRVKWENYLNCTLTEEITNHKNNGLNSENIFKIIKSKLLINNFDDPEILRRLKISVCARVGEQKALHNRIRLK